VIGLTEPDLPHLRHVEDTGVSAWNDPPVTPDPAAVAPAWQPDARLVDGLSVPAFAVDAAGVMTYCNPAMAAVLRDGVAGGRPALGRVVGDDPGAIREVLARVLAGETWTGDLALGLSTETRRTTSATWTPVRHDGRVTGALVLLDQHPGSGLPVQMLASRLSKLAAITADLLFATSIEEVTEHVTEHITDAAGATVGSLSILVDDTTLALVGIRGGTEGAASRWATYPVADNNPAAESVRTGRTITLTGLREIEDRYPGLESAAVGERSLLCLPLSVSGKPIGVITLSFPGLREIDPAEQLFLRLLADTCAQAVDRISAQEESRDREDKLRFLAEASVRLAGDLDYESTLTSVAGMAVPWFADWCAIALEDDGLLRTLSVAHAQPEHAALIQELQTSYPPSPDADRGAYRVLRTGESDLIPEVSDELLAAGAQDERHLGLLRRLNFRSGLSVPLKSRDRVFGVITWVTGEEGRRFTEDDRAFGEDLALRAAVAIDNSQLHSQLRDSALSLQQAVLPQTMPVLPGWDLAVRYLPAGRSGAGGDFYDVLPLDADSFSFFVGDVMGRGVEATSMMAQMRSAMRTLIAIDPDPLAVMHGLDKLFDRWHVDQLVTVVYGVVDAAGGEVQVVNGGHPAPVVVRADGTVEPVATPQTLILGAGGGRRGVVRFPLAPRDTLLAFTDGLVERRGEDPDHSLGRLLRRAVRLHASHDLTAGLAALVDEVRDPGRDDDVAAIALRRG
jgi:serine phosphatase RsbU (regulator of sigma subunit)